MKKRKGDAARASADFPKWKWDKIISTKDEKLCRVKRVAEFFERAQLRVTVDKEPAQEPSTYRLPTDQSTLSGLHGAGELPFLRQKGDQQEPVDFTLCMPREAPQLFQVKAQEVAQRIITDLRSYISLGDRYKKLAWELLFFSFYLFVLVKLKPPAAVDTQVYSSVRNYMPTAGFYGVTKTVESWLLNFVASVWTSPVCGNQLCEVPYEVASFGRFGCKVDCGEEYNLYQIVVRLQADFRTSPSAAVSPPELLESVTWNLCYRDSVEESVGLGDQCWYETDQTFESSYATVLEEFQVPDKDWFIRLENDYYHLVDGHVYVGDAYEAVGTTPEWISCTAEEWASVSSSIGSRRALLQWHKMTHSLAEGNAGAGKELAQGGHPREGAGRTADHSTSPSPLGTLPEMQRPEYITPPVGAGVGTLSAGSKQPPFPVRSDGEAAQMQVSAGLHRRALASWQDGLQVTGQCQTALTEDECRLLLAEMGKNTLGSTSCSGSPTVSPTISSGFSIRVISTLADEPRAVYAADIDGDGDIDVLSASLDDDKIAWYANDGSGGFGSQQVISTLANGARSVYAADVDGDGDIDVLSASSLDDKTAWYANDGSGGFGSQQVISTLANGACSLYAADVDGDGDMDVLSASFYDDTIAWYANDGSGVFGSQQVISRLADGATSVFAVDVDGDGDKDVLSASISDDEIAWYANDGSGGFGSQQVISRLADGPQSVYAADVDGDGDIDVLSASFSDKKIAWYANDGSGGFGSQHVISTLVDGVRSVYAADVDGDGDIDVLSASETDDKIAWYANDGSGGFGSQQVISTLGDGAFSVYMADVDGDGDMDVLSASRYDDKIAWYFNSWTAAPSAPPTSGEAMTTALSVQLTLP
ncbi:hypothetical protein CYMTET_40455 [Cymbomonas tetramitiformis]|uniref:Uncharacterized protein n=1 Tax=Cymbomonas tetramitiformis TaxID=36881 RepID=A0AAE0C9F3_9CHLO|nr:hypothetical protein CYMTET_40455 [Cymbomonas tetramitiformis]